MTAKFPGVFVVLGRLHRIHRQLADGLWVPMGELARREEVSRRTIMRCINFLRDQLEWDIEGGPLGVRLRSTGAAVIVAPPDHANGFTKGQKW